VVLILENADKFLLILAFLIPGFVSLKIYDFLVPREERDYSKTFINLIGYSTINFILLSWLIYWITMTTEIWIQWVQLLFLFILFPALWPVLIHLFLSSTMYRKLLMILPDSLYPKDPISNSWDWVFRRRKCFYAVIYLKNGEKIAGVIDNRSYLSSFHSSQHIYLGEEWTLDENNEFKEARPNGVLILDEISKIDLYPADNKEDHQ
jgi:hypothetical protein